MNYMLEAKKILAKALNVEVEKIPDSATLHDLEQFDSLTFEKLVLEIQRFLGHEIDVLELLKMHSVEDLAALLAKR